MNPLRCPHCRNLFLPDPHNAWHQRYCTRRARQRARNRASCRAWRRKNPDHFRKDVLLPVYAKLTILDLKKEYERVRTLPLRVKDGCSQS